MGGEEERRGKIVVVNSLFKKVDSLIDGREERPNPRQKETPSNGWKHARSAKGREAETGLEELQKKETKQIDLKKEKKGKRRNAG